MSKNIISFSESDAVKKIGIMQVLITVEKNQSFSSAHTDNLKFKSMFPVSNIAQSYKQRSAKIK